MKKLLICLTILSLLVFTSCQVSENISLEGSKNTSETSIEVYDFFVAVINDFSEFLDTAPEGSIMDSAVRDFANGLAANSNNSNVVFQVTGENSYYLSFDFSSLNDALSSLGSSSSSILQESGNSISFYLDIDNYPELKDMIPFLSDPNFEVYGPEYNQGMSEADYLDMIYYLLGEEAPGAIQNSMIAINITVPGTLTETSGVTVNSENSCTYSFPLIDFLLLNEPMSFSISWN